MALRQLAVSLGSFLFICVAHGGEIDDKLTELSSDQASVAVSDFNARKSDLIRQRRAAVEKIETTFESEMIKLRDALVAKLEITLGAETKSGELDAAVQIRDAIAAVKKAEVKTFAPEIADADRVIEALQEQVASLHQELAAAQVKLGKSAIAQIEVVSGSSGIGEFRNNARAFSNRKYHWVGVPEGLAYKHVTTVAGGGGKPLVAKIVRAGWMAIAISHDTPEVLKYLRKEGWRATNQRFGYSDKKPSLLHIYTKQVEPGLISLSNMAWAGPVIFLP